MTSRFDPPAHRLGFLILLAAPLLVLPSSALGAKKHKAKPATPETQACIEAYKSAQSNTQSAHLRAAKDALASCLKPACPALMRQECTNRYMRLDAEVPSVIPVVTDNTGAPLSAVEVKMDGELLTSKLDGHGLPVDPGKHEFSFSIGNGVFAKKNVMIVQGQRNRPIAVVLHVGKKSEPAAAGAAEGAPSETAATKPEAGGPEGAVATENPEAKTPEADAPADNETPQAVDAEETRPKITATRAVAPRSRGGAGGGTKASPGFFTYATAGIGVLGITGYFLLNTWAKKDNDKLAECAAAGNLCPVASVDHIHKLYLEANISGAVGLAALATSAFLYYRSQTQEEEAPNRPRTAATTRPARRATTSLRMLDVRATPSGALATIGGAF